MIETLLFERDLAPDIIPVECFILPGIRKVHFNRQLKYRYDDFAPKLLFFLKRLGYKKYLQKFFFTIETASQRLLSREYELPLFLSALHAAGILRINEKFVCNGVINQSSGTVQVLPDYEKIVQENSERTRALNVPDPVPLPVFIQNIRNFIKPVVSKVSNYEQIHAIVIGKKQIQDIPQNKWLKVVYPEITKNPIKFSPEIARVFIRVNTEVAKKICFIFEIGQTYDASLWSMAKKYMKLGSVFTFILPEELTTGSITYKNSTEKTLLSLREVLNTFNFRYYIAESNKKENKQIDKQQCEKILTL